MTREELGTLLMVTQRDLNLMRGIGTESNIEMALLADEVMRKLWPVLAQVWAEGYGDAYDDAHDSSRLHPTINPYGEVSA